MYRIASIRPVLLSAPYAGEGNLEVMLHLPRGLRTTGLVEITLDNGIKGLGEGYLAVFAPHVFKEIVGLLAPLAIGHEALNPFGLMKKLEAATGYWSFEGAARHVLSAFETALLDIGAQLERRPLWQYLAMHMEHSDRPQIPLRLYASGGDSLSPDFMAREIEAVSALGIDTFKIRARKHQADKAIWCRREANGAGVAIAVDMCQNLAVPSQEMDDILAFLDQVYRADDRPLAFLEEALGPHAVDKLPLLRQCANAPVAGGEIVTVPWEMRRRIEAGCYDIIQPDATVIGGADTVFELAQTAHEAGIRCYPHCWGSGVGMLANYHAAVAGLCEMAEWPLPHYDLREALFAEPLKVQNGCLTLPDIPGLGARLTPEIEREYPFREEAVYNCVIDSLAIPEERWT